jgi:hypothetical protein
LALKNSGPVLYGIPRSIIPQSDRQRGEQPFWQKDNEAYKNYKDNGAAFYFVPRTILPAKWEDRNGGGGMAAKVQAKVQASKETHSLRSKLEKHQSLTIKNISLAAISAEIKKVSAEILTSLPSPSSSSHPKPKVMLNSRLLKLRQVKLDTGTETSEMREEKRIIKQQLKDLK